MKCASSVAVTLLVILSALCDIGHALPAGTNGTNKFDFGTGPSTPAIGSTFDEIVVESNLNVRGKTPSARSHRTQLLPVTKSSDTKTETVTGTRTTAKP